MASGERNPNELELAILGRLGDQEPVLAPFLEDLRVSTREFTGAGCFTRFACASSATGATERQVGLDAMIRMPNVSNGLGAVLFCKGEQPELLEVYTYGDEIWDGVYDGFRIAKTV